jgi:hypothetical protein
MATSTTLIQWFDTATLLHSEPDCPSPPLRNLPQMRALAAYATQMPRTATSWNRCGAATAERVELHQTPGGIDACPSRLDRARKKLMRRTRAL